MSYFESHITIEPVFEDRFKEAAEIAAKYKFKLVDLLIKQREQDVPVRSQNDSFMIGRGIYPDELADNMSKLIKELQSKAFTVWRYKIQDVQCDSRFYDMHKLLPQENRDVAYFDD